MKTKINQILLTLAIVGTMSLTGAQAAIDGIGGPTINLTAKEGHVSTPDGNSIYCWGYANGAGLMQYPGPTIIATQGMTLTFVLNNQLPVPCSIVFPGQTGLGTIGGVAGAITSEASPGGTVTYTVPLNQAGTYLYNSGTRPDLQVEMGLIGALVVYPRVSGVAITNRAYAHTNTVFDREYLFLLSEMDPDIHYMVECGKMDLIDTTSWRPSYWFINGRCGPDTLSASYANWLPNQPYNCSPTMYPGQKVLMRLVGGGRDVHPFHHHGNNSLTIARDGRMLTSTNNAGPDLAESNFTVAVYPGGTADAIFTWTGKGLGWDVYGHTSSLDPLAPNEDSADHGKPFPVILPSDQELTYGMFYGGSPFLGTPGNLPPGDGGYNPNGGMAYMWHSHSEKELTSGNIFPGGMLTMMIIEPWP
jgi:manganese oxidase